MAECRSLIEFPRVFEHHRRAAGSSCATRSKRAPSPSSRRHLTALCDHSPTAAVDALVLLAVLAALGFLMIPHVKLLLLEARALLHPAASCLSVAALAGAVAARPWRGVGAAQPMGQSSMARRPCAAGAATPWPWSCCFSCTRTPRHAALPHRVSSSRASPWSCCDGPREGGDREAGRGRVEQHARLEQQQLHVWDHEEPQRCEDGQEHERVDRGHR